MSFVTGLQCRECGQEYPKEPLHVCENCFGPLEIQYDYDAASKNLSAAKRSLRASITCGAIANCCPSTANRASVCIRALRRWFAPSASAQRSASRNFTSRMTRSITRLFHTRIEWYPLLFPKPSNSVSTPFLARPPVTWPIPSRPTPQRAGLDCYVFIPDGLEQGKIIGSAIYGPKTVAIKGNYDDVNRLCSEIGDKYGWAFVNVNLRPYYSEGAKTHGFEVAEQLGWKLPQHIVVASAGGTILPKLAKGFKELDQGRPGRRNRVQNLFCPGGGLCADHQRAAQGH